MRLNTAPTNTVEMNGVASTSQFTIRASAKAFSILSDGLYSNKIRAIIRELSTNALDSHVAAGKADVPFTVNIPNSLAPWFSVRDYGVGLSHDEVINIYTSYFTSTKTESDDFVGALGLGSKSPFSYTDNFTVTAIKHGRKGNYSAYIDDTGVPAIALMDESDTDEPDGVEVRLSVHNNSDFWKFAQEASSIYKMFSVTPQFTGETIKLDDIKYFKRDIIPGVHIRENIYNAHNVVIMGSIEYPIKLSRGILDDELEHVDEQSLEIHLPIGAVEMSASREDLSYTVKTVDTIKELYRAVSAALSEVFDESIKTIDNQWELADHIYEYSRNKLFKHIARAYVQNNPTPFLSSDRSYLNRDTIKFSDERAAELNIKIHKIESGYGSAPTRSSRSISYYDKKNQLVNFKGYEFSTNMNEISFIQGIGAAPVSRVKEYVRNRSEHKWHILVTPIDRKMPMLWDQFLEDLHNPPAKLIKDIEDFPKPEPKVRAAATPVYEFVFEREGWGSYKVVRRPAGDLEDIDIEDSEIAYVKLYKQETHLNGAAFDLREALDNLRSAGLLRSKNLRVIGVRGKDLAEVEVTEGWVPFDQMVTQMLDQFTEENFATMYMKTLDKQWRKLYTKPSVAEDLKDSPVMTIKHLHNENYGFSFSETSSLVSQYGSAEAKQKIEAAVKQIKSVIEQYPLIKYINEYTDIGMIADYVKLIDNAKGE